MSETGLESLGPYEHVIVVPGSFGNAKCHFCGWAPPAQLAAGTAYGRGRRSFCGTADLRIIGGDAAVYVGLVEVPPEFVVERTVHAGWIDWSADNAPLCSHAKPPEETKP